MLQLASADYQPEGEEYLEQIGANRIEHTLVMSRSVWHKVRESKFVSLEGIQLPEMLQGLQPVRKPIPGGMSWVPTQQLVPDRSVPKNLSCSNSSVEAQHPPELADAEQE